jgi:hypothetical protein
MGANLSSLEEEPVSGSVARPKLGDIPESCIALVLARLDPPEICNLARLNRAFRGASSADFIWESKLPSNYQFIIDQVFVEELGLRSCECKRDIFACLSRHHCFDGGTKEIWLDKRTGGVCLSISSRAMSITGIDDRRYWNRIPTDESRFQTVAYLQQIWWFEADGELDFEFPRGTYTLFFRLQLGRPSKRLGRRVCSLEHVHGWDLRPVRLTLSTSDGQQAESKHFLDNPGSWVLYRVGDFTVEDPKRTKKIKFSATQIDCTHIKGGLCVDCVLIYPRSTAMEVVQFCKAVGS